MLTLNSDLSGRKFSNSLMSLFLFLAKMLTMGSTLVGFATNILNT